MRIGRLSRPGAYSEATLQLLPLLGYRQKNIPTNAGWTTATTGSGGVTSRPDSLSLYTGTTANSSVYVMTVLSGMEPTGSDMNAIDYSKNIILEAYIARFTSVSTSDAIFSIGDYPGSTSWPANTFLQAKGFGFGINNMTLIGVAFGTAANTVNLNVTLTHNTGVWVAARLIPGKRVVFYVNGVERGSITASSGIPTGVGLDPIIQAGIRNGSTASSAILILSSILVLKER